MTLLLTRVSLRTILMAVAITIALVPMISLAAVEKTDGFVCPVFNDNSKAGEKNPNAVEIGGGDSTILGPDVRVPLHATNGDGAGTPGGAHSTPGDTDYTAIWSK
jgi:hypothetical protein